ncbi:hypothetical protein TW85_23025 [Marinomonas sp. S3726]|uniref:hypothetical protein n=1 Tax=Marinomonas sp. S3726 TaxID=579484 RepID=UPI0005F9E956|nr:hypothetical protein [Marinomonas sp. S3726]KJZ08910.1 hypothetical protein TW85_23025 [Marinomonas sp. S3726]
MRQNEANKKLKTLIDRVILHKFERDNILNILINSDDERVPIRVVHTKIVEYRKKYSIYIPFTDDEREMIDIIFHYWG